MKKVLLLLFVGFISTGIYAQIDSANSDKKLTAKEVYSDIKAGFSKLVTNLEGPAKHVYKVYIYQHKATGIALMLLPIVFIILGFSIILLNHKKAKYDGYGDEDWNKYATFVLLGIITTAIGLITLITFFTGLGFTKLINPEYHAIQDIIETFK